MIVLFATPLYARPHEPPRIPIASIEASSSPVYETAVRPGQPADTLYFGGTYWDAVDMRWEALADSVWTFETGVASVINTDPALKEVGLHSLMEGWYGIDMTAPSPRFNPFRRSQTCAIDGWSVWAGVTQVEADSLGWEAGQGYGNEWHFELFKTFAYPGTGSITLSFDYRVEAEDGYDKLWAVVEYERSPGVLWDQWVSQLTGVAQGTETVVLEPGVDFPETVSSLNIVFRVTSDRIWSDEDGLFVTDCGHSAIDNVSLTGAITDFTDFETDMNGWTPRGLTGNVGGDWSDIRATSSLDPPGGSCTCTFGDSVLAFIDTREGTMGGHGPFQFNLAGSPWIDLAEHGADGWVGKFVDFAGYKRLPLLDYVFLAVYARWKPDDLPSPIRFQQEKGFYPQGFVYYGDACDCAPGRSRIDLTRAIPPDATEVQIAVGVVSYCNFYSECTGISNQSPWFDDIRFGIHGLSLPPAVLSRNTYPRDAFPTDPSPVNLVARPARFDALGRNGTAAPDLLTLRSDYNPYPSAVHVLFRVRPGPAIDLPRYNAWIGGFGQEAGWYSARLDTMEEDGPARSIRWRTTFHEDDPQFTGTDDDLDPLDPAPPGTDDRLANDIFPDDLFTPGTRVDLFYRWSTGLDSAAVSVLPDTTGGNYFEMEVLPSSLESSGPSSGNNRVLFVNKTSYSLQVRGVVESALASLLPGGSANAENTAWDRLDYPGTHESISLGQGKEHDLTHLDRYDVVLWFHQINAWPNLFSDNDADVIRLREWLDCPEGGESGDSGCGRGLYISHDSPSDASTNFFRDLGIEETLEPVHTSGGGQDTSSCIIVRGKPENEFAGSFEAYLSTPNGHGAHRLVSVTEPHTDATHESNLGYELPLAGAVDAASISTFRRVRTNDMVTGYWRSVVDGFPIRRLRGESDCTGDPDSSAIRERLDGILTWFDADATVPVDLLGLAAERRDEEVVVRWRVTGGSSDHLGFHVYKEVAGQRVQLTPLLLRGRAEYEFVDTDPPETAATYWIAELVRDGTSRWFGPVFVEGQTFRFRVLQNAPNPFFSGTILRFELPGTQPVTVRVFDAAGKEVRRLFEGTLPAGKHEVFWDGRDGGGRRSAAGIYFYRVETRDGVEARKMVRLGGFR